MPVSSTQSRTEAWRDIQLANRRLTRRNQTTLRRERVDRLQDSYEASGGADNLNGSQRLRLDRRAMAQASIQWVNDNTSEMRSGLASCRTTPQGQSCRNAQAMRSLREAAQRYMD